MIRVALLRVIDGGALLASGRRMNARDPWFWASFALVAGASCDVSLAPSIACAVFVIAVLARAGGLRWPALAAIAVAFAIGGLRAHASRSGALADYREATTAFAGPTRCVGRAVVTSSPVVRGDAARVRVQWLSGECDDRPLRPFAAFLSGVSGELARGDVIEVSATLTPAYLFRNEGTGDGVSMIAHSGAAASGGVEDVLVVAPGSGLAHAIDRARAAVRTRIVATYHPDASALGRALVLGETDLAPEDDAAFRSSGLSHLLAVSGTHIVVAILGIVRAAKALLVRVPALAERTDVERWISACAAPLAFVYSDFAGGGGSALRAAAMMAALLLTRALGRRPEPSRAFAAALATGAILDPLVMFDVSFSLSVSATLGLFCVTPLVDRVLGGARDGRPASLVTRARRVVGRALASTLGPSIACAPALATLSPRLPLAGVLANVVAAPIGEAIALPVCLAHAVLAGVPSLELGAARVGSGALLAVLEVARVSSSTGWSVAIPPPTEWQVAFIAAMAAWSALTRARARLAGIALFALAIASLELEAGHAGRPTGELRVSALDVGQGDSILVDLPDGSAMLVDGGGLVGSPVDTGVRVVAPVLRARRRKRIGVVVLTHPHPDHFTGLLSGLEGVDVGAIWDTGEADRRGGPRPLVDFLAKMRARGVPILGPRDLCGEPRLLGGAVLRVLAPCPGVREERGANDNSFVMKLSFGDRSVLLTGDAEHVEERELLDRSPDELRADLLKVGHHGSRTSTSPEFVAAVSPSVAFISCGVRNRFGHPHPGALAALRAVAVFRTDRGGEWRWQTDGHDAIVTSAYDDAGLTGE